MVNGLHLYSAFIQSAVQFLPLIHPFTHTFTHQRRSAAMQGTDQLVRSDRGLGVSLRDTSTRPGWDRTGDPPTARRQLYLLSHIAPLFTPSACCGRNQDSSGQVMFFPLFSRPAWLIVRSLRPRQTAVEAHVVSGCRSPSTSTVHLELPFCAPRL